jgi:hypothetical protein
MTNTKKQISEMTHDEMVIYLTQKIAENPQRVKTLDIDDRKQIAVASTHCVANLLYIAKFNNALQKDLFHEDWQYFFEDARNSPIERIKKHGYYFEKSRQMILHAEDVITEIIGFILFIRNTIVADKENNAGQVYRNPHSIENLLEKFDLTENMAFDEEPPTKMPTNFARYLASLNGSLMVEIEKSIKDGTFQEHKPYEEKFLEEISAALCKYRKEETDALRKQKQKVGTIINKSIV